MKQQCFNLPADKVPTGTPLNKKCICQREKNAGKTGMQPWGGWPLPTPEHQYATIHAGGMLVSQAGCCCQKTLWEHPHHQHMHQAHKISDGVILMTPEVFLDLTEITSPDALLASQSTPVLGVLSARPGGAVTLQPAEILPFTVVACSK